MHQHSRDQSVNVIKAVLHARGLSGLVGWVTPAPTSGMLLLLLSLLLAVPRSASSAETVYAVSRTKSVKGNDLACNDVDERGKVQPYCRQCGGLAKVAAACTNNPNCKGFDMENHSCGYLKKNADEDQLQYQGQFTSFCAVDVEDNGKKWNFGNCPSGDYILWLDWDSSPGFALDCNFKDQGVKKPYCLIQGNHLNLMDECNAIKDCDGFTTQISDNGRFGYLVRYEGWASARQREGWMFFAKSSSNPTKKSKGRRRLQHVNTTIAGP